MNTFISIFSKYNTNKAIDYGYIYDQALTPYRENIKLLFEIGVCNGGSTRGFKEFFPNAIIVGFDIDPISYFKEDRINIRIGNATTPAVINAAIAEFGCPDITLDDGSHRSADIKATYKLLYPHTKFCYIIEDLGTQYVTFENGSFINDGVPATNIVHSKIDELIKYKDCEYKKIIIGHSCCLFYKN